MSIQCVLFDLDGTFADTAPDLHYALDQVMITQGLAPLPIEQVRPTVSHGSRAMLKVGFGMDPGDPGYDSIREAFLNTYLANIARKTRLFDGMQSLLDTFDARGIAWGIVTNKPAWLTDPLIAELGLGARAACIVSGDTCENSKPHPEPILHGCRLAGSEAQHCVYIGDAQRDIEAGKRAGMRTVVALFGYLGESDKPEQWQADALLNTPKEIADWISENSFKQPGFNL